MNERPEKNMRVQTKMKNANSGESCKIRFVKRYIDTYILYDDIY